jgi:type VI secretion system secreted protein VgrG
MAIYTQADRPLAITTPLGKDVLLAIGLRGHETLSRLFTFQVDLLAEVEREIPFDRVVGQNATVELRLANGAIRYVNGMVRRFSQGARNEAFVRFRAELAPDLWRLAKVVRSRIFQHVSVPDILRQVLSGLDVAYEVRGTYYERDFCVQYRESDFQFVSRLMEEEGIFYFFKHTDGRHQMVITDVADQHPSVPGQSDVIYEEVAGGEREEMRVTAWEKTQELRSGKYTLWDHCFELPGKHLEAQETILGSVTVGKATHKLAIGGNEQLEIYDYPGGYAQRFDGVGRSGEPRPQDLQNLFRDKDRVAKVRIEEEEAGSLEIAGASNCGHFTVGHSFVLQRHFNADDQYVITSVEHDAHFDGNYRSDEALPFLYENRFTCRPVTLPFRASRTTDKPAIAGVQTATVVGHRGEPVLCDKYGRVKVQFHWDREGKHDGDSSCWLRVAQPWAGKGWGAFFWPRVGHEVVVAFEEGDPDRPIVVGSVYNAENMPPFAMPASTMHAGIKSCSLRGAADEHFNGIVFVDEKNHEHLAIHSERHMSFNSESDKRFGAGRHKSERVASTSMFTVGMLPGGGGSGGGGWKRPAPLGVPGLNSTMVYGENLQATVGLNHQFAIGSNFQICINPAGLAAGVPGFAAPASITGLLGGGLGGNMQCTIGTSANVVLGRSIEINLGPGKVSIEAGGVSHQPAYLLCGILGAAALIWILLYAGFDDDNERATETVLFQALFDVLLSTLMTIEVMDKQWEMQRDITLKETISDQNQARELYNKTFRTGGGLPVFCQELGGKAAAMGVLLLPLLAIATEEESGFDRD